MHSLVREAFSKVHEAGLFLYDIVQAGGKRLSSTFVTRTLVGEAGITYKYLGLRIFAHPWCGGGQADVGQQQQQQQHQRKKKHKGESGAAAAAAVVAAAEDAAVTELWGQGEVESLGPKVVTALRQLCTLNAWLRRRAERACAEEGITARLAAAGHSPGSFDFNLTLINRMEPSGHGDGYHAKLKPEPIFGMGKASVSWHADSCLEDYSTIGVYHVTTPPVTTSMTTSKNRSSSSGGGGGADWKAVASAKAEGEEVVTPPLVVPLRSGDAYFMLDDFNHYHEHLVLAGEDTLRYSSTHRVSVREGNTWAQISGRCREVLSVSAPTAPALPLAQLRAEQALQTELEGEWLYQFWAQGRRHARLHPWWRRPMNALVRWWRELERRSHAAVTHLLSPQSEGAELPRAVETLARCLEARRQQRARWAERLADAAYRALPPDAAPLRPGLWGGGGGGGGGSGGGSAALPYDLTGTVAKLRERYAAAHKAATGGTAVATSARALVAGATSNWAALQQGKGGLAAALAGAAAHRAQQQAPQTQNGGGPAAKQGKPKGLKLKNGVGVNSGNGYASGTSGGGRGGDGSGAGPDSGGAVMRGRRTANKPAVKKRAPKRKKDTSSSSPAVVYHATPGQMPPSVVPNMLDLLSVMDLCGLGRVSRAWRTESQRECHYARRATPAALDPYAFYAQDEETGERTEEVPFTELGEARLAGLIEACGAWRVVVALASRRCVGCGARTGWFSYCACARTCAACFRAPAAKLGSLSYAKVRARVVCACARGSDVGTYVMRFLRCVACGVRTGWISYCACARTCAACFRAPTAKLCSVSYTKLCSVSYAKAHFLLSASQEAELVTLVVPEAAESGCVANRKASLPITHLGRARDSAIRRFGSEEGIMHLSRASAIDRFGSEEAFDAEMTRRRSKAQDGHDARYRAAQVATTEARARGDASAVIKSPSSPRILGLANETNYVGANQASGHVYGAKYGHVFVSDDADEVRERLSELPPRLSQSAAVPPALRPAAYYLDMQPLHVLGSAAVPPALRPAAHYLDAPPLHVLGILFGMEIVHGDY
ncbi:FTO catalytic domain-containing protein [Tribonema minus]|uniref:Alpha-ketoglutarate-dependent dioxygenase FTO n=1 Tax=Tribonema minus TaxID=303371 RepID=A0A835ZL97_9STRA|nr:FTO catalytic domain-containing protein [Tribonema minus]